MSQAHHPISPILGQTPVGQEALRKLCAGVMVTLTVGLRGVCMLLI
jgi:hypothetical protein